MLVKGDITVIGGGIAGMCAAVGAARSGAHVLLVHDRPVLGGNASSEIGVSINGAATNDQSPTIFAREAGLVNEIQSVIRNIVKSPDGKSEALLDMVYFDFIYREKNIELFLNTHAESVKTDNGKIICVHALQLASECEFDFESEIFIDCSGDGKISALAGAEFMFGRESRDEYGEDIAPEKADSYLQGSTLMWQSTDCGHPVEYTPPSFAYDIEEMSFCKNIGKKELHRVLYGNGLSTVWWLEYGGQCNTISDNEAITHELRRLVYGFWDYVKNSGKVKGTENYRLTKVAPVVGKRESRRFKGDYVLTQHDVQHRTEFPDAVSTGGWLIDIHAPLGIYDDRKASGWIPIGGMYNIPYRCLYSKNIDNLLFGGRIISTSHVAFGSTRVIATGAAAAQAAGTAAVICVKKHIAPRTVGQKYINMLRTMLQRDDQYIIGFPEQLDSELGKIEIRASSVHPLESCGDVSCEKLDKMQMLVIPAKKKIESFELYVENSGGDTELCISLYAEKRSGDFIPGEKINEVRTKIKEGFCGYIPIKANAGFGGERIFIEIHKNSGLSLGFTKNQLTGVVSLEENDDETSGIFTEGWGLKNRRQSYIAFKNVLPVQNAFAAENLLNGINRPRSSANCWISNGKRGEYVEIIFDGFKYVDEAAFVFNDDLRADFPGFEVPEMVSDYNFTAETENGEYTEKIRGNFKRIVRHAVGKKVRRMRIDFVKNCGSPHFELLGIKIYNKKREEQML